MCGWERERWKEASLRTANSRGIQKEGDFHMKQTKEQMKRQKITTRT
jgi:hypothetical protein